MSAPWQAPLLTASPEQFEAECRGRLAAARQAIAALKARPEAGVAALEAFDEITAAGNDVSAIASVARNAHPDPRMRQAGETCEQEADALGVEISLDPALFALIAALDLAAEDAPTRHYQARLVRDFRRSGVDRDAATRERVRILNDELLRVGQEFSRNIREDVRSVQVRPEELEGLPEDFVQAHPPGADGLVRLTTDTPDLFPVLAYARQGRPRELLWRANRQRARPKNVPVLQTMLEKRHELAGLLGEASWADHATSDKMMGNAANARAFIDRVDAASKARAARDLDVLLAAKRRDDPAAAHLDPWESEYLKQRVRAEQYGFDAQTVRPFFEMGRVLAGLLQLTARLFGIEYRAVPDAPVWHPDVTCTEVWEDGQRLGRFYLDLFPRADKYKHAAQFSIVSGKAGRRLPEAALICNFPRPGKSGAPGEPPALMEHGQVTTLFHEFGHLLHHLLGGQTRWAGLSGVRTEWDFVEAPSQLLEEWAWDADVLATFARHIDTGASLPAETVARMRAAEEFGKGLQVRMQLFYGAVSLGLHDRDPAGLDVPGLISGLQTRFTPFPVIEGSSLETSFGHLESYSALYYTYMWSLVLAKDLGTVFAREGLLATGPARRYRAAILAPGGSRPAAELVRDFLGREYAFDAFAAWLDRAA